MEPRRKALWVKQGGSGASTQSAGGAVWGPLFGHGGRRAAEMRHGSIGTQSGKRVTVVYMFVQGNESVTISPRGAFFFCSLHVFKDRSSGSSAERSPGPRLENTSRRRLVSGERGLCGV